MMESRHPGLVALGALLKQLRAAAGNMPQKRLAHLTEYAESTLSGVETGNEWPSRELLQRCDAVFKTTALVDMYDMIKELKLPAWFHDWVVYEEQARFLRTFELMFVPGLLQTPEYARIVLHGDDGAVNARLERQAILRRDDPPDLHVVVDEAVVWRQIEGDADGKIMRAQLQHLLEVSTWPNVTVQVISAHLHRGSWGPFVLATLRDGTNIAYSEGAFRGVVSSSVEELTIVIKSWESIRTDALHSAMSHQFIRKVIEERWPKV